MAAVEFKTKQQVTVDPITGSKDTVYMVVDTVEYNGTGFVANCRYETRNPNDAFHKVLKPFPESFTIQEADTYETALSVTGTTVAERLQDLIEKTALAMIDQASVFGLTANDFEKI